MKQLNFVIAFLFTVAFSLATQAQDKPNLVFETLAHDFGTFKEAAGIQTYAFDFVNKGTTPLVINSVRASCGCTTPKWTREPVAPGAKGTIEVSYDPKGRPGSFNKTVSVQSNAENALVTLQIKGTVEQREKTIAELYPFTIGSLRAQRNNISFVKVTQSDVKTETLELVNDTEKPIKVDLKTVPDHIKASLNPGTIPAHGKSQMQVTFDASKINDFGFVSHRIYLAINDSNDYRNSIGVSATIEEDFSKLTPEQLANAPVVGFDNLSFDFGDMKPGEKVEHTFTIKNQGKNDLIIRKVKSSCGCTAVTPSKTVISAGESAPIKVVFDSAGKKGRQSKTITVITNDPKSSTSTLRISSNVASES